MLKTILSKSYVRNVRCYRKLFLFKNSSAIPVDNCSFSLICVRQTISPCCTLPMELTLLSAHKDILMRHFQSFVNNTHPIVRNLKTIARHCLFLSQHTRNDLERQLLNSWITSTKSFNNLSHTIHSTWRIDSKIHLKPTSAK